MTVLAMATSTAKEGKAEALVEAARHHAKALEQQPGCRGTFVLLEKGSNVQVSISVFETEADLEHALEATRAVISGHHIEEFLEGPSRFQLFDVL